jgi:hypothetical protein
MEETHHHADSTSTSGASEQMVCFAFSKFILVLDPLFTSSVSIVVS